MTILLVIGVAVVILGALVLMRFPDRPGGRIAWQGFEVSSIGAGLPLIVVGIAAVAIAGGGAIGGDREAAAVEGDGAGGGSQTTPVLECPDDLANSLPAERIKEVEVGTDADVIFGPAESHAEPFGLRLTEDGEAIGAMTVRYFPASDLFKIRSFVDADCQTRQVEIISDGGTDALRNGTDYRIPDLRGQSYILNLGKGGDMRVNFGRSL